MNVRLKISACGDAVFAVFVQTQTIVVIVQDGEFDWDVQTQGYVLGSFFYGYVITQLPGGRLAELFGGKWIFGIGILVTSIFTLLTPIAAKYSVYALIGVRVFEGKTLSSKVNVLKMY